MFRSLKVFPCNACPYFHGRIVAPRLLDIVVECSVFCCVFFAVVYRWASRFNIHCAFVVGVEMFKKSLDQGLAGDNVGVLLRGVKREDILRGQVLAQPGTVKTHKKFKAEVYVLNQKEGGRHTPFFNNYR